MKSLLLIAIFALLALTFRLNFSDSTVSSSQWQIWKVRFGKSYMTEQEVYRYQVYLSNQQYIKETNNKQSKFVLGENKFMDLTKEEFAVTYLGENIVEPSNSPVVDSNLVGDVDWRTKGVVSPIKDQGQCGSCWSFGCTGGLESANMLFGSKVMTVYSEQQLVDCSSSYGNDGCNGGLATQAYQYVIDNGIVTESEYPYVAEQQTCKINKGPFKISKITKVSANNCDDLKTALNQQPISVSVDASNWSFYSSGIFDNCGTDTDHAVLAVGYTSTYWIVKNSWGESWGEQGYIRLAPGNTCTICLRPSYPSI
eukprot:TRINITY_DN316_c0_g3_i2.p1 TRINITY_DN316_c0_g3~~TRINITY_DN316_c0_g3_i2.p1  ORF type:complete len:311 (+),score=57.78 TRINITY_DN316_c0_g3_i2:94-1026(+)